MATVTLGFLNNINTSLQRKTSTSLTGMDLIYFVNNDGDIVRLGPCIAIGRDSNGFPFVNVDVDATTPRPKLGNFIFFGKDTQVGTSGVIGYYAEIEFINNSTSAAELFSVSTEFFPSSK
jgi:hypothetical protein